eukprot:6175240-Pleurochrysis_carterae.AAC.1
MGLKGGSRRRLELENNWAKTRSSGSCGDLCLAWKTAVFQSASEDRGLLDLAVGEYGCHAWADCASLASGPLDWSCLIFSMRACDEGAAISPTVSPSPSSASSCHTCLTTR